MSPMVPKHLSALTGRLQDSSRCYRDPLKFTPLHTYPLADVCLLYLINLLYRQRLQAIIRHCRHSYMYTERMS